MRAGHGDIRLVGDVCVRGCGRPARELGRHCTRCWMALTSAERHHQEWLHDVDRQAAARAALDELRADLDALPNAAPRGRAA